MLGEYAERAANLASLRRTRANYVELLPTLPPGSEKARQTEYRIKLWALALSDLERDSTVRFPTLTFSDRLTLDLGDLTVELTTKEPDSFLPINLTNLFMASPAHWDAKLKAVPASVTNAEERAKRLIEREFNLSYMARPPAHNEITAGRWYPPGAAELSVEEGIAKTLESRWRTKEPERLDPRLARRL